MYLKSFVAALGAAVCVSAQGNMTTGNGSLTSLIMNTPSLAQLADLLVMYPSVAATLGSAQGVTVFAPNNQAIRMAKASLMNATVIEVQALLSYHVVKGMYLSTDFMTTPQFPTTMLNDNRYSRVTGGQVVELSLMGAAATVTSGFKLMSTVVSADNLYNNGIVHVIDKVLTIPPMPSTALAAGNLTDTLGAIIATNLTNALDTTAEITIFAPSNAAFKAIGSAAAGLSLSQLTAILEYHVVVGHTGYSSRLMTGMLPTMLGKNVMIEVIMGAVYVNGARVINSDILVSGGVLHVIDSVLNPRNATAMPPMGTAPVPQYVSASSAALPALLTSGLPSASSVYPALEATTLAVAAGYSSSMAPLSLSISLGPSSSGAMPVASSLSALIPSASQAA